MQCLPTELSELFLSIQSFDLVPSSIQIDTSYEEVANELIADIAAEVAAGAASQFGVALRGLHCHRGI